MMGRSSKMLLEPIVYRAAWEVAQLRFPDKLQQSHIFQLVARVRKAVESPPPHEDPEFDGIDVFPVTPGSIFPLYVVRDKDGALGTGVELQFVFGIMTSAKKVYVMAIYNKYADLLPSVVVSLQRAFQIALSSPETIDALRLVDIIRSKLA